MVLQYHQGFTKPFNETLVQLPTNALCVCAWPNARQPTS